MKILTKRLIVWAAIIASLLLIPLCLTIRDGAVEGVGWNWTFSDFVVMGSLLFGSVLAYELVARKMSNFTYRIAFGITVVAALLLIWVNAAVGIIGEPGGANLMYFGVIAVAIIGALIARFKPRGMARALFATALAQGWVSLMALIFNFSAKPGPLGILTLNGIFVALFVGSAFLFLHASYKIESFQPSTP